jgi:molybdopterin adenylyltransferase
MAIETSLRIGIVTVSDRASQGVYEDLGGPAIRAYFDDVLSTPWTPLPRLVPDEQAVVEATLRALVDDEGCDLVVTTGGTGPAPRDVTPEATEAVAHKLMPGFGERMRAKSLEVVPTAILSRQTAAIRGRALIVNLPGKPKSIRECLDAVMPAVPYCLDLIGAARMDCHPDKVAVFRPKA